MVVLFSAGFARADAIVVTRAMNATTVMEIFIEDEEIRVELEAGVRDLPAFAGLLPDQIRARIGLETEPLEPRLARFFSQEFVILADGAPLSGSVVSFETRRRVPRDEITGEPVTADDDEGEPVVFVVLSYRLVGRPEVLTFRPPTAGGDFPTATIGFITYHRGLPVMDFRCLGSEETLDLDWADPWFSKYRDRNLWRQYDSPLNVFLYVEPYEIRVEIVTRPVDIQTWSDVGVEGRSTIPVEIQEDVKQRAADFLAENLNLTVDGEAVVPQPDRVNFLNRTLRTSTVITPPRELDASSATLGVIFLEPMTGYPEEAAVTWELFPERVERIPAAATDEAGPLRFFLQRDDNVPWWKNFLKNPTLPTMVEVRPPPSLVLRAGVWLSWIVLVAAVFMLLRAAASAKRGDASRASIAFFAAVVVVTAAGGWLATRSVAVDEARAAEITTALLHNVYRAFDYRDEELIYDTLAHSVTGELLTETYLETRRGLELASQGGARAKVQSIEMSEVAVERSREAFIARCTWSVAAAVGHWGHIHQRVNQYVADLTVEPVDGDWKITGMELVEEQRL